MSLLRALRAVTGRPEPGDLDAIARVAAAFALCLIPLAILAMAGAVAVVDGRFMLELLMLTATLGVAVVHLVTARRAQRLRRGPIGIGEPARLMKRLVVLARVQLVLLVLIALVVT